MVTRGIDNWEKHKEDVFEIIRGKYGEKRASKFIKFYADRYNKYGRTFIDYKLAFWLMDDYKYLERVGTRFYACVGIGGSGKTTFLMNVFKFLDPSFKLLNIHMGMGDFINDLKKFQTIDSMKGTFLDEPDDNFHVSSKEGKAIRSIFGKARQQKLIIGICATDLKDIPPYFFRKLNGIFFTPFLGKYMFFKDRPKKGSYVLQQIRNEYSEKGYKIFYQLKNKVGCLSGKTQKGTPFTPEEIKEYLAKKKKDYEQDIGRAIKLLEKKSEKVGEKISDRDKVIIQMRSEGLSLAKIGKYVGLSDSGVRKVLRKYEPDT